METLGGGGQQLKETLMTVMTITRAEGNSATSVHC